MLLMIIMSDLLHYICRQDICPLFIYICYATCHIIHDVIIITYIITPLLPSITYMTCHYYYFHYYATTLRHIYAKLIIIIISAICHYYDMLYDDYDIIIMMPLLIRYIAYFRDMQKPDISYCPFRHIVPCYYPTLT